MSTIYSISQGVEKILEASNPPTAAKYDIAEIKRYVVQVINSALKMQHFTQTMAGGENIPDGLALAEYNNVPVESYGGVSRATLPVIPVSLPLNMGIYHVSKTDDIINGFIPFQPGELQMIGEEHCISDILGQIGYEPRGKHLVFNKDITTSDTDQAIDSVYLLLVVKDLSLYGDWDLLPIEAGMEADIIQRTFDLLKQQFPENKRVDVITKQQEVQQ
jgi:hypothetical protein